MEWGVPGKDLKPVTIMFRVIVVTVGKYIFSLLKNMKIRSFTSFFGKLLWTQEFILDLMYRVVPNFSRYFTLKNRHTVFVNQLIPLRLSD